MGSVANTDPSHLDLQQHCGARSMLESVSRGTFSSFDCVVQARFFYRSSGFAQSGKKSERL